MNVQKFIAAAVVFAAAGSAGSAFAADAAVAAPIAASASVLATNLNLPAVTAVTINGASRNRAEVGVEAVEFAKHYKTTLAVQLEQYKN